MNALTFLETLRTLCTRLPKGAHTTDIFVDIVHFWRRYAHSFPYTTRVVARTYLEEHLGGDLALWTMVARGQLPLAKALAYVLQNPHHAPFLLERLQLDSIGIDPHQTPADYTTPFDVTPGDLASVRIPKHVFTRWTLRHIRTFLDLDAHPSNGWNILIERTERILGHATLLHDEDWNDVRRVLERPHQYSCCVGCFCTDVVCTYPRERLLLDAYHYTVHALASLLRTTGLPTRAGWETSPHTTTHHRAHSFACTTQIATSLAMQFYPCEHKEYIPTHDIFSACTQTTHYRLSLELATEVLQDLVDQQPINLQRAA